MFQIVSLWSELVASLIERTYFGSMVGEMHHGQAHVVGVCMQKWLMGKSINTSEFPADFPFKQISKAMMS